MYHSKLFLETNDLQIHLKRSNAGTGFRSFKQISAKIFEITVPKQSECAVPADERGFESERRPIGHKPLDGFDDGEVNDGNRDRMVPIALEKQRELPRIIDFLERQRHVVDNVSPEAVVQWVVLIDYEIAQIEHHSQIFLGQTVFSFENK